MKIGKFNVFPRKVNVTIGLKCGKVFHFYCDKYSWSESGGLSFDGAPNIRGTLRPTLEIAFPSENISWIQGQSSASLSHLLKVAICQ